MRSFWLVLPKLIFWKGDLTLGYVSIQTFDFFTFPNFLSLKSFENSWGNLYSKIFILAIKLLIYCEKCEQDCLKKIYFALYILSNGSSFWKKLHFGSKKKFQRKNNLYYSQSWKFSKVFWPKPNMRSIAHTKPLTLELLRSRVALCLLKIGEGIWSYQKNKSRSFKESGTSN